MMMQQGAAYCARISGWNVVDEFLESGLAEAVVTLTPSHDAKKECCNRDLPIDAIQVRLIRVELEDEIEVLATNLLDSDAWPHHLFKNLYAQRWPVEEDYKKLKSNLQVENGCNPKKRQVKISHSNKNIIRQIRTALKGRCWSD